MRFFPLSVLLSFEVGAQTGTFAGAGYRNAPAVLEAAPGQVLIVSVGGAKSRLVSPVTGRPEPPNLVATVVAGFSAQLVQAQERTAVGIHGASQLPCPATVPACQPVTNITLQVPFELVTSLAANEHAVLEIREGNAVVAQVPVRPVPDRIHVINSCDECLVYYSVFGGESLEDCTAAVVRPRGGLITPARPVRPGEPLVAFAYGMGDANPSPAYNVFRPGLTKQPFVMRYAVAGRPVYWAQEPDGAALTTSAGTYQIHFTVPPVPADRPLPPCNDRGIYGNLRVTISGRHSSDTFELCVAP